MTAGPCGIVLAAGAGSRFGMPKALAVRGDGAPWTRLAVDALGMGGCAEVLVVIGADADAAERLVPASARAVRVPDWREGVSASLRTALAEASGDAAVVVPVDTPDLVPAAVARLLAAGALPDALAHATYGGMPGHPVVLGRNHWAPLAASLAGDAGARAYLAAHAARAVECGDLWSGRDIDTRS